MRREAGVSGFIVPDMPLEESGIFRDAFDPHGLTLVTLVAPNTSVERMREYKPHTSGFVYVVSVLGTTGGKVDLTQSVTETMRRARAVFDVPLALGFGLQTPDQLDALPGRRPSGRRRPRQRPAQAHCGREGCGGIPGQMDRKIK